jgi:hypothetical protein
MTKYEMMRGRTLLLNLNNARIRYSRAKEEGSNDVRALAHEVAYLQAMWREHLKKAAAPELAQEHPVQNAPFPALAAWAA